MLLRQLKSFQVDINSRDSKLQRKHQHQGLLLLDVVHLVVPEKGLSRLAQHLRIEAQLTLFPSPHGYGLVLMFR